MSTVEITVAGKVLLAPVRYSEGDTLRANEANALNGLLHENLRNNFAKRVKDAEEAGSYDQDAIQEAFQTYANEYDFGIRRLGATTDPVESEALALARSKVKSLITASGKKFKDYSKEKFDAAVEKLFDKNRDALMESARERLRIKQEAAAGDIADLGLDEGEAPAEKPKRSRKAA